MEFAIQKSVIYHSNRKKESLAWKVKLTWIYSICVRGIMRSKDSHILDSNLAVHPEKQSQLSPYFIKASLLHSFIMAIKTHEFNPSEEDKPAIYRVNGPKWWIQEGEVWDDNPSWVHQLNQMGPCIVQASIPKPVPPDVTLTINNSIVTCMKKLKALKKKIN